MDSNLNEREILARLAQPFPADVVSWKPQSLYPRDHPTRALAVAYIDARDVAERLDEVLGLGWSFTWEPDGENVRGSLAIALGDLRVMRADVGEPGDGDDGRTRKAAVSDALKRCAVQFGVGRYLYRLPKVWVGYDEQKRQLTEIPRLPDWALPKDKVDSPAPPPAQEQGKPASGANPTAAPSGANPTAAPRAPASGDHAKPAEIVTSAWRDMLDTLKEGDVTGHYLNKNGEVNGYHVAVTAYKLGFKKVTDENIAECYDKLLNHAEECAREAAQ